MDLGPARRVNQIPDPGPCRSVHQLLRRRIPGGRHQDSRQPAAGAESERRLRKNDRHRARHPSSRPRRARILILPTITVTRLRRATRAVGTPSIKESLSFMAESCQSGAVRRPTRPPGLAGLRVAREVSASGPERLFGAQGGGGLGRGGPAGGPECTDGGDAQSGQGQQQEVGDTQDVHKAAGQHYAAEAGRR